jgi:uncharacterized damage-inducible protein DinB
MALLWRALAFGHFIWKSYRRQTAPGGQGQALPLQSFSTTQHFAVTLLGQGLSLPVPRRLARVGELKGETIMKKTHLLLAGLVLCICAQATPAQAAKQTGQKTARQVLETSLAGMEKQLLGVAEAMPADKYSFAPTNGEFRGVRNFAKQLKHVGAVHYVIGAAILGEAPPADAANEQGPDALKTKAEVTKYLQDSLAYLRRAVATIDEKNLLEPLKTPFGQGTETRLALVIGALEHSSNHYGQVVEYLRTNGVIPPGSQ